MGTPDFATGILQAIVNEGKHEICAVVTAVDKPAGRGMKIQKSSVKSYAEQCNLPVLQPESLRNEQFLQQLISYRADVFVVVAFRMLPQAVWSIPPRGTINLHASLLPQYRGAAPINWAIINGETVTGVSTFFINEKIDEGKIILKKSVRIEEQDNAGILHDKLMSLGQSAVLETLQSIEEGTCRPTAQNDVEAEGKTAPKIFKEHCRINWNTPAGKVHDLIRGMSPYPAAFTSFYNEKGEQVLMKIFASHVGVSDKEDMPGIIHTDDKNYLYISCQDGCIFVDEIQLFGKKRLIIRDFLLGNKGLDGKKTC
ncbi:MAG: methionyl-tRNA formyltransferase [Bacteroidales bacterium]|nr:methionyl-tRNA formyltransferase [Bacteroidales bacterium]